MTVLKSLTFTALPKDSGNPTLNRRTKTVERLEEQKLLLNDPNYVRTVRSWTRKDGQKTMVEKQIRVIPWFRQQSNGSAVPSIDKMLSVIDTLITAVRNGELDEQLALSGKQPSKRKVA